MFERFSERSRGAMALANREAQRLNHEYIGTEHLLLGMVAGDSGVAVEVFKQFGVDLPRVQREVDKLLTSADKAATNVRPQTPRVKKAVERAIEEARMLNAREIDVEHLLLGVLQDPDSVASQVLMNLGVNLDAMQVAIQTRLASEAKRSAQGEL